MSTGLGQYRQIVHLKSGTVKKTRWTPGSLQDCLEASDEGLTSRFTGFEMPDGGLFVAAVESIDFIEIEFREA